jgi:short-subunit dehydrogenase
MSKSIVITGVSSGIGRASALVFQAAGWDVVGTVRELDCSEADRCPPGIALEPLDLSRPGAATQAGRGILERHGCPDVLLNNAGTLLFGALETTSQAQIEQLYQVNVFSQLELTRAFLPAMRARGSGTVANVTSLGGTMVFPYFAAYNSTKWALEAMSEGLWHELKPFGIKVKAIEPGFVQTSIWGKALPDEHEDVGGPDAYRPYLAAMLEFESSIKHRTSPEKAAEEVYRAVTDASDRLRYPVAAYARALTRGRKLVGAQRTMRLLHRRWMRAAGD